MTLAMPDSVNVKLLPVGYDAYLGYIDGEFTTAAQLAILFPEAHRVILTVTGGTLEADGCDIEAGDLDEESGAAWAARKLAGAPASRPVLYASVSRMDAVVAWMANHRIARPRYRLLSAHWDAGAHVCGPDSCGQMFSEADGTQWTNVFRTPGGALVDMSILTDGFFDHSTEIERLVNELAIVRPGSTGPAVRTVQGLCAARGYHIAIDGVYGQATRNAVELVQAAGKIAVDGVVGPQTWPVLLGVA